MPGFAQPNHVSRLRVINPGSDSLEVESLSSAMAPPPCYSSYKEGTTSATTVCLEDSMKHSQNDHHPFESDSHSAHSLTVYPGSAPTLEEESPPSPYSFEDLPKISHQPELHNYLAPAAPSSTYTQSCVLGVSRSQSRITHDVLALTSCDDQTPRSPNWASEPHAFIPPVHARLSIGHSSTPNISSLYQQGAAQRQVYRHIPASQPLLGRLPCLPNVVNTDAGGEVTDSQVEHIPTSDFINHSSGFQRGFSSSSGSTPFGHLGQGLPTNFISLSRKSTSKRQTFPLLPSRHKVNSSSITGIFLIDPHLRLPAGLLKLVDSSCPSVDEHPTSLKQRRKNLVLEAENGGIDVDIQVTPSKVPHRLDANLSVSQSAMPPQSQPRRSTDKRYLQPGSVETQQSVSQHVVSESADAQPTRLDLRLKQGYPKATSGKIRLIARINAPSPRPPIHLVASTIDHAPSTEPITNVEPIRKRTQTRRLQSRSHPRSKPQFNGSNKSPIILHLPHNLHGLLTVHITAGNIDAHVRLSKELTRVAAILSENSVSRGYFISSRGLTEFGDRSQFGEELEVVMEGEDGWVMVEGLGPSHGVVNERQTVPSMPRGGDHIERDEEWYGDKVDVFVGDGKVYLQFLDEPDPLARKGFWQKFAIGLGCR